MKNTKKTIVFVFKHVFLLLLGTIIGFLALWTVHLLPTEKMHENVERSMTMLQREFDNSQKIIDYEASLAGTFTDCLMLEHAIYKNAEHSLLEQMLCMYRGETAEGDYWVPGFSLRDYVYGVEQPREVEYARYWHGYLVVLKPLLLFTYFNSMRVSGGIVQYIAIALIFWLCMKRKENFLGMGFVVSMPFMFQFTMYFSLSLSICFYIMVGLVLVQLWQHDNWNKNKYYPYFFFIGGMLTAYFDFLTYPLVTLAYPLCICLCINKEAWKTSLKKLIGYSVEWGTGYFLLWANKWMITDVLLHKNTIKDGLETILTRVDTAENRSKIIGFFYVIKRNLSTYQSFGFVFLALGILMVLGWWIFRNKELFKVKERVLSAMCVFGIALFPFAWFFITQNHSEQHYMYTCKIFAICAFATVSAVGKLLQVEE